MSKRKIAIASDHAAWQTKARIVEKFDSVEFVDFGTNSGESMDYPDTIAPACRSVADGKNEAAIVLCGTGIGASITANKVTGIRAALCHEEFTAEMSRRHNNANVLAVGARVVGEELIFRIVETWLKTPFDGGRHERRLGKIHEVETESKAQNNPV